MLLKKETLSLYNSYFQCYKNDFLLTCFTACFWQALRHDRHPSKQFFGSLSLFRFPDCRKLLLFDILQFELKESSLFLQLHKRC